MILISLSALLLLVVGGCGCVVGAVRGGPRWTRGVSRATLPAGELMRDANRRPRGGGSIGGGDD
ncbi:hypothetical protein AB0896_28525 [Streptomyces parvulus]|uniref:hypothetical protein n=1 Tax=Streptomyces parvulus TaxID=146923 RepID=UPI003453EC82